MHRTCPENAVLERHASHSPCTRGSGCSCFWQMKGVLFWEKENRGPLESEEVPPTSLTSRAVSCAGTHPLGTVLTTEQDQDGPPSPRPDERGKRVTQAGSASRSLRGPFPVTCWKEEPGKRTASHGDTSQVHGDSQHAQNTLPVWVKDKPTCFTRVMDSPRGTAGARLGDPWESPARLLVPGRASGPGTCVQWGVPQ